MKKYLIISLIFLSCSTNNNSNIKDKFVEFKNSNQTNIKQDDEIIKDKGFAIQIPNYLIEKQNTISYYFLQNLRFKNNQRIITLYLPNKKYTLNKTKNKYSREDFTNQLNILNILEEFNNMEFMKNRYSNIVLLGDNFFVMCVNIEEKNINDFNYSINSIKLE